MDDLISRQAAIDEIARWVGYLDELMIWRIQHALKHLPSAQKKGHWIDTNPDEPLDPRLTCSECGNTDILHSGNFCPNCGADMRGDEND